MEGDSPADPLRPSAPPVLICCLLTPRDLRTPPPGPAPRIAPGCSADCCLSACCQSCVTARRPRKCPPRILERTDPNRPQTETWSVSPHFSFLNFVLQSCVPPRSFYVCVQTHSLLIRSYKINICLICVVHPHSKRKERTENSSNHFKVHVVFDVHAAF